MRAAKRHSWRTHQVALGARSGLADLHLSENETSSSLLKMLDLHTQAAPNSRPIDTVSVEVSRLDNLIETSDHDRFLLKVDTQGSEGDVLSGAERILPHVSLLQLEMSLLPLYSGQLMWQQTIELAASYDFRLCRVVSGFSHPETGEMLQMDGIFVNDRLGRSPAGRDSEFRCRRDGLVGFPNVLLAGYRLSPASANRQVRRVLAAALRSVSD